MDILRPAGSGLLGSASSEKGKSEVMSTRSLLRRIEKLEQRVKQFAQARSRFSPDCICFPENEEPFFGFPVEGDIAFAVKCPLHGDRFKWPKFYIYVAAWLREKAAVRRQRLSAQYQKAWAASFPADLWPAEEESTDDGIYLRLKDGTRFLAGEFRWKKNSSSASSPPTSASTEVRPLPSKDQAAELYRN